MKTLFLVVCFLLASTLSIPTPTLARELAGYPYYKPYYKPRTVYNKPGIPCDPRNGYRNCLPKRRAPPPAEDCGIYGRYSRKCRRSPPPPVPPPPAP
ncbi:hypothetical protein DITRI_Ditri01bG0157500 [Diplodiscus trichospermus]